MAISRELIVKPADIRISIQCKLCGARVDVSHSAIDHAEITPSKKPNVPVKCPSCERNYLADADYQILTGFCRALSQIEKLEVIGFRILDTHHS